MPDRLNDRAAAEARFARVFAHARLVRAYAARRGARDAEEITAEVMTIAWRRLADVPEADPRPWLIATARNVLMAEHRRGGPAHEDVAGVEIAAPGEPPALRLELDPELERALNRLSPRDREAILLVALEDLTPAAAAASLGITAASFRVRLHRARRRLEADLRHTTFRASAHPPQLEQL